MIYRVERCRTKLEEKHVALELANNTLMKNFDQLKGSNAEIAEKVSIIDLREIFSSHTINFMTIMEEWM